MSRTIALAIVLFTTTFASADEPRFIHAWGKEGTRDGEFHFPIGIAIHDAAIYVTDHYNNRVQKFDFDGAHLATMPVLPYPGGIAIDKKGVLYLSHFPVSARHPEKFEDRISVYRSDGTFVREWGKSGEGDGEFRWPGGLAIGPDERVYVADQTNHRVQVFDKQGKFLAKFGEYGSQPGQFGGGMNPKSRVGGPQFLTFDREGHLYATEGMVCRVQKLTRDGKPLLLWGNKRDEPGGFGGTFTGFKDKSTTMDGPIAVLVDNDNHVWVSAISGRIQKFDTDGKFLGGIQSSQGTEPGKFSAPHGIAINANGELFVVDSYNHRIQKFATK